MYRHPEFQIVNRSDVLPEGGAVSPKEGVNGFQALARDVFSGTPLAECPQAIGLGLHPCGFRFGTFGRVMFEDQFERNGQPMKIETFDHDRNPNSSKWNGHSFSY